MKKKLTLTVPEIDLEHKQLMKKFVIDSDLYREAIMSQVEQICGGNLDRKESERNYYKNMYSASCSMERRLAKLQKDIEDAAL